MNIHYMNILYCIFFVMNKMNAMDLNSMHVNK